MPNKEIGDREQLIYLLEPIMSGSACEHESGSCEMVDCRMCQAIHLADHLIANGVVIQKQGEWVEVDRRSGHGVCSNCNRLDGIDPLATHCRYCGAKMKEVK